MNKKRLGKGLSALIPETGLTDENTSLTEKRVIEISLDRIKPNPKQPRHDFDQVKLREMAQTISEVGVIQPILVVDTDNNNYTIIAGERRYRAAKLAGLETIPAVVSVYSSDKYMEIALIENLQREDLNPIEEAIAYRQLIDTFHLTQEDVARKLGRSRSAVTNTIRLLLLPEEVKSDIASGRLTQGQARPLLALQNESEQYEYAQKIINEKLTSRQIEKIVQDKKEKDKHIDKNASSNTAEFSIKESKNDALLEMEEKLRNLFGTKVSIRAGKKEGKVEFTYYDNEDLERLLQLLLNT